ncbi:hypothetical protein Y032_0022g529 [Ancylostoma ceylanicum]|nr:hypothetical protein Y032_0022g529 [Ancylostoma ceylanicum]
MERLKEDLKMLAVLDPSLRILELDNGELAMVTAGEVHLQKCLKDLEDLGFSDLEECHVRGDSLYIRLRAAPLPDEVVSLLEKSTETLQAIRRGNVDDASLTEFKTDENPAFDRVKVPAPCRKREGPASCADCPPQQQRWVFARKLAPANWYKHFHEKRAQRPFWDISKKLPESAHRRGSECANSSEYEVGLCR